MRPTLISVEKFEIWVPTSLVYNQCRDICIPEKSRSHCFDVHTTSLVAIIIVSIIKHACAEANLYSDCV